MARLKQNSTVGDKVIETIEGSQNKVNVHSTRTDNPHNVNIAQIGALSASHAGSVGDSHGVVSKTQNGFMSSVDKQKLEDQEILMWMGVH